VCNGLRFGKRFLLKQAALRRKITVELARMLEDLRNYLKARPRKAFLTVSGLISALSITTIIFTAYGDRSVNLVAASLRTELNGNIQRPHILSGEALAQKDKTDADTLPIKELDLILTTKFKNVNQRALHHLEMAVLLAQYAFAQSVMVIITTCVAGVFLFFVGRKGFNNVDPNILIASSVMAAAAAGFLAAPSVFQLSDNLKANAVQYVQLQGISDQIVTYAVGAAAQKREDVDKFLQRVDTAVNLANQISFSFDISKAPSIQDIPNAITPPPPKAGDKTSGSKAQ
jgi:hypothetical protein